jgi:hypothetical protein
MASQFTIPNVIFGKHLADLTRGVLHARWFASLSLQFLFQMMGTVNFHCAVAILIGRFPWLYFSI